MESGGKHTTFGSGHRLLCSSVFVPLPLSLQAVKFTADEDEKSDSENDQSDTEGTLQISTCKLLLCMLR